MFWKCFPANGHGLPVAFLAFLSAGLAGGLSAQGLPSNASEQINQQAALLATQPAKVRLKPAAQETIAGTTSNVSVELLNADGNPVPAKEDWQYEVLLSPPSGEPKSQTVRIKKGESSAQFEFSPDQPGLTSISVRPLNANVRPDKTEVFVRPAKKTAAKRAARKVSRLFPADGQPGVRWEGAGARFREASFAWSPIRSDPGHGSQATAPSTGGPAALRLMLNTMGSNYLANGIDAAVFTAVFDSPDLSPAPTDIHIWLHWTNGSLEPFTIAKGSSIATTRLTSPSPADVEVSFVSSTPSYQAKGDSNFTVHFVPPGVALLGPTRLSVVDNAPVWIVFVDARNNPVSPGKNWQVTLRSTTSKLRFAPQSFNVLPDSPVGSAVLFPISFGTDTIEAVLANYNPAPLAVVITFWLVLGLCLVGGVAGGAAAYSKFKGSWMWRVFLGILGGLVLCWLYVYLALPNVDVNIAHNTFSVFFVALIGGYMGTTVLDLAAKKLGLV